MDPRWLACLALLAACEPPPDALPPLVPAEGTPDPTTPIDEPTTPETVGCTPVGGGDPWEVERTWTVADDIGWVELTPMVANLTDDDGDGRITPGDVPDVAAVSGSPREHFGGSEGPLLLLDGATGELHQRRTGPYDSHRGLAIADVDDDGDQEILLDGAALDGDLQLVWPASGDLGDTMTVADLDNDGHAEVIGLRSVVDGRDGTVLAAYDTSVIPLPPFSAPPITADLDLDGEREILIGDVVLRADGTHWWGGWARTSTAAAVVANLDDDPEGEVLVSRSLVPSVDARRLEAYDTDGRLIVSLSPPAVGSLAMADLDADGAPELIVAGGTFTTAWGLDGSSLWTVDHQTIVGGSSAFDFDRDGAYEVVVVTASGFEILDGRTGSRLARGDEELSTQSFPVITDVDGDGSADILVAGDAISLYGNPSCLWPKGGSGWGIHDFDGTNLGELGEVPTDAPPIWAGTGNFRARP